MAVLLLNASVEPLRVIPLRRAIGLILAGKAETIAEGEGRIRSATSSLAMPAVVRLNYMVRVPFIATAPLTRQAVLVRDGRRCQFLHCNRAGSTIDHVVPKSRGGRHAWTNVVAACLRCNLFKGNRTVEETRLRLIREPVHPQFLFSVHLMRHPHATSFLDSWRKYLVAVPSSP